jgi:hypothetical protein
MLPKVDWAATLATNRPPRAARTATTAKPLHILIQRLLVEAATLQKFRYEKAVVEIKISQLTIECIYESDKDGEWQAVLSGRVGKTMRGYNERIGERNFEKDEFAS